MSGKGEYSVRVTASHTETVGASSEVEAIEKVLESLDSGDLEVEKWYCEPGTEAGGEPES